MIRLPFFLLAGAAMPAALSAQTVSPPVPWEDTPPMRLNVPAGPAPRAALPAPAPAAAPARPAAAVPQPLPPAARPAPQVVAASPAPVPQAARPLPAAASAVRATPVPGQRIDARWRDPRFGVADYGAYGLYPPASGSRWVRHYDDALLVDQGDIVRDARSGLDWDEYGDWDEADGVPVYVGRGDYEPDQEDYAYVEEQAAGVERAYANNERYYRHAAPPAEMVHPGARVHTTRYVVPAGAQPPCPPAVHAEPCDCGHYPPGTVITETIVKRPPVVKTHVYYVERTVAAPRAKVKRLYRNRAKQEPAPAPVPYGEKG